MSLSDVIKREDDGNDYDNDNGNDQVIIINENDV